MISRSLMNGVGIPPVTQRRLRSCSAGHAPPELISSSGVRSGGDPGESGSWLAWWLRIPVLMSMSVCQVGLDVSAAVLDRRIRAHGYTMQLDQLFFGCAAFGLIGVFFESP
jgi:hypothetical protein